MKYNLYQSFSYPPGMEPVYKLDGSSCTWYPTPVAVFAMTGNDERGREEKMSFFLKDGVLEILSGYDSGYGVVTYTLADEEREALARAIWPEGFQSPQ